MIEAVIAGLARQIATRLAVFFTIAFVSGALAYAAVAYLVR